MTGNMSYGTDLNKCFSVKGKMILYIPKVNGWKLKKGSECHNIKQIYAKMTYKTVFKKLLYSYKKQKQ